MNDAQRQFMQAAEGVLATGGTLSADDQQLYESLSRQAEPDMSWQQRARLGGQGLAFGFGDEIEAGITSLLTGEPYGQVRDVIREDIAAARESNPWESAAWELGGGLLTGGLGAGRASAAMAGRTLAQKAGIGGLLGAGAGALQGAGEAEDVQSMPAGALTGAALGGTIGAAIPAVGRGFSSVADQYRAAGSPEMWAKRKLATDLRRSKSSVDDVREFLDENPGSLLADYSTETQRRARSVYATPGQAGGDIDRALRQRTSQVPANLQEGVEDVAGPNEAGRVFDELEAFQKQASDPAYAAVRAQGNLVDDDLIEPLGDRARRAIKEAERDMRARPANRYTAPPEGMYDFDMIDTAKIKLDQEALRLRSQGQKAKANLRSEAADAIRNWADPLFPGYSEARSIYEGPAKILDAIDAGRKMITTGSRQQLRKQLRNMRAMSPQDQEAVKLGMVEGLQDAIEGKTGLRAVSQIEARIPRVREVLGDDIADGLERITERLRAQQGSANYIAGGSSTAETQEGIADLAELPLDRLPDMRDLSGALNFIRSRIGISMRERVREERTKRLAPLLLSSDADEIAAALQQVIAGRPDVANPLMAALPIATPGVVINEGTSD